VIPYEVTQGYGLTLDQLSTAALADLNALMVSLSGESPDRQRAVLFEAFPEVFNPYAAAASSVSATFYEEVRSLSNVDGDPASTLDRVDSDRWGSLVGWGTQGSMFERGGAALVYSLLSGGLTAIMREMASDTIIGNGQLERVQVGYQRVPSPGCCAFCHMVASKGDLFKSAEDAERVIGRGMPIPKVKRRGGQARGIRPRGSRAIGESYHDHCKCKGVPVFEDNYAEMQDGANNYLDAYAEARNKVYEQRKADGYKGYGDQATSQKMILAEMRQALGVK
jgi:hypothetical protein